MNGVVNKRIKEMS